MDRSGGAEADAMRSTHPNISRGSFMRVRYRVLALPAVALGAFMFAGCGPTNEENLGGETSKAVPHKEGTPDYKSYGEAMGDQAKIAAKNKRGKGGKAAAPTPPKTPTEPPKSDQEQPKSQ
jgi:hypothetical protein